MAFVFRLVIMINILIHNLVYVKVVNQNLSKVANNAQL